MNNNEIAAAEPQHVTWARIRGRRRGVEPTPPDLLPLHLALKAWEVRNPGKRNDGHVSYEDRMAYEAKGIFEGLPNDPARGGYGLTGDAVRWWPLPSEVRACCRAIESTVARSVKWPMTRALLRHCNSVRHVAALYGVDERELRRAITAKRGMAALRGQR